MAASAFHPGATPADPDGLFDIGPNRPGPGSHDSRLAICAGSVDPVETKIRSGRVDAHRLMEGGGNTGKMVVARSVEDVERCRRETGR
ncbi:hypothetical protein CHT98_14755 (plasmid) [Azospirillum brasilense]|uniref:Uncharacterized protein n=2 Tax=Azospirillum brasilense TaxID=192 RepID=A0A235HE13_AZOBR|nr:hypothetical protein CHT98_14755 [Azospirillum brasilense]